LLTSVAPFGSRGHLGAGMADNVTQEMIEEGMARVVSDDESSWTAPRSSTDRVPDGSWIWMLTPSAGDQGEDSTPPSP
jgi:hypothetical protein